MNVLPTRSPTVMVRPERPEDHDAILRVHTAAFGRPDEAQLVSELRANVLPYVGLVAKVEADVVGHIAFSPVTVEGAPEGALLLGLGPVAVRPDLQHQGIGSTLVSAGMRVCEQRGAALIFVLGDGAFYSRFGFQPAAERGFHFRSAAFDQSFHVREIVPVPVPGGWVQYTAPFDRL